MGYIKIKLTGYNLFDDTLEFDVQTEYQGPVEKRMSPASVVPELFNRFNAIGRGEGGDPLSDFEYAVKCLFESDEYWDVPFSGDPTELVGNEFEEDGEDSEQ